MMAWSLREEIAARLLDRDEGGERFESARALIFDARDAAHDGDCTNKCIRCLADRALDDADRLIKLMKSDLWRSQETEFQFDLLVAKLEFEPGDVLIFKTDLILTKEQATAMRGRIDAEVPPGIKTVLAIGLEVTQLKAKDVPLDWRKIA